MIFLGFSVKKSWLAFPMYIRWKNDTRTFFVEEKADLEGHEILKNKKWRIEPIYSHLVLGNTPPKTNMFHLKIPPV